MKRCVAFAFAGVCAVAFVLLSARPVPADALDIDALVRRQGEIGRALLDVAAGMDAADPASQRIRSVLYALATRETVEAVQALEALRNEGNPAEAAERVAALARAQDRTIEALRRILGVVDLMQAQTRDEEKAQSSTSFLDDEEALQKLQEAMEEFIEEQRKVLTTTAGLAKRPVDDFTPEEEEQLKQLEATQERWERFLEELYNDLSKMQVQDFSNPVLLEELVEIYSEVKMAKDALEQQAVEIAVPAEAAGMESAESILTNLEKWLPDTPDRERWQMEEPLEDFETPMAELPTELEDLVGDLMEMEEDLMADVEDATSAWADSLDKGAGWDAKDGPISNMSAKGVTGNRLPNSSEISGRSAEGRTGKAAGEYVEDTAMGKGGRRTPTRLTPDPYEEGVVDDRSQDSGGGATGGGKISGAGEEGLEGPPPPQLEQQLAPLAGRQGELRNLAERVEAGFRVMNYPTESIERVVQHMRSLEDDMRSGRYANIARERQVLLTGLRDVHAIARGEAHVQRDFSRVGARLEDEILDVAGEETPRGFEELVEAYYRALSR